MINLDISWRYFNFSIYQYCRCCLSITNVDYPVLFQDIRCKYIVNLFNFIAEPVNSFYSDNSQGCYSVFYIYKFEGWFLCQPDIHLFKQSRKTSLPLSVEHVSVQTNLFLIYIRTIWFLSSVSSRNIFNI